MRKIVLYVTEGATCAHVRQSKPLLRPGDEYAIATGDDGEFGEWQIANLAELLAKNRLAAGRRNLTQ